VPPAFTASVAPLATETALDPDMATVLANWSVPAEIVVAPL
jgi:hypothetical protein